MEVGLLQAVGPPWLLPGAWAPKRSAEASRRLIQVAVGCWACVGERPMVLPKSGAEMAAVLREGSCPAAVVAVPAPGVARSSLPGKVGRWKLVVWEQ